MSDYLPATGSDFWLHAMDDFGGADTAQPTRDILNGMAPQGATFPPAGGYRVVNRDPDKYSGMRSIKDFSARGAYDNSQPGQDVYEILDDMGRSMWTGNFLPELPEHRTGREFFIRKNNIGLKVPYGWTTDMVKYAFESAERTNDAIKARQDDSVDMKALRAEASYLRHREGVAALRREAAMKAAVSNNSHPYHPENPFNVWRRERTEYIDGDDAALARMLGVVCVEDWDRYDEVAHKDVEDDRRKDAPAPVAVKQPWWRKLMFWRKRA